MINTIPKALLLIALFGLWAAQGDGELIHINHGEAAR